MVLAFAGDSTTTKFFVINSSLIKSRAPQKGPWQTSVASSGDTGIIEQQRARTSVNLFLLFSISHRKCKPGTDLDAKGSAPACPARPLFRCKIDVL
jgi:hypothetical protein